MKSISLAGRGGISSLNPIHPKTTDNPPSGTLSSHQCGRASTTASALARSASTPAKHIGRAHHNPSKPGKREREVKRGKDSPDAVAHWITGAEVSTLLGAQHDVRTHMGGRQRQGEARVPFQTGGREIKRVHGPGAASGQAQGAGKRTREGWIYRGNHCQYRIVHPMGSGRAHCPAAGFGVGAARAPANRAGHQRTWPWQQSSGSSGRGVAAPGHEVTHTSTHSGGREERPRAHSHQHTLGAAVRGGEEKRTKTKMHMGRSAEVEGQVLAANWQSWQRQSCCAFSVGPRREDKRREFGVRLCFLHNSNNWARCSCGAGRKARCGGKGGAHHGKECWDTLAALCCISPVRRRRRRAGWGLKQGEERGKRCEMKSSEPSQRGRIALCVQE